MSFTETKEPGMVEMSNAVAEFVDAFNSHEEARIRAGYADDVVFQSPDAGRLEGVDAAVEYSMTFVNAFPDVHITVKNQVETGDWVAYEFDFEGTHTRPLVSPDGEIPATNRRVTGSGAEFVRIQGGKVTEEHLYYDQVELLTQLGLMPE